MTPGDRERHFRVGGVAIAYVDEGEGDPILLIHGFASSAAVNWTGPGWVEALVGDGRRVIAIDNRGHGRSDRPHDPAAYGISTMAGDAAALLDHLGIGRADVMGYSMGARIAARLALSRPDLVRSLILGGIGAALITGRMSTEAIVDALEADDPTTVTDPDALGFRRFADRTGGDRFALAACMRAMGEGIAPALLGTIRCPVLIAVGTEDGIAAPVGPLLSALPAAEYLPIPRRDHMRAVGDRVYRDGVLAFLRRRG